MYPRDKTTNLPSTSVQCRNISASSRESENINNVIKCANVDCFTISAFIRLLAKISQTFPTEAAAAQEWDKKFKDPTPRITINRLFTGNHYDVHQLKGATLKPLVAHLQHGELPFELDLVQENINLINHIAKFYCMVNLRANRNIICIWKTLAYCLVHQSSSPSAENLFFGSFFSYVSNKITNDCGVIRLIFMDNTERDLLLMSHFANIIGHNLYVYNLLSAQDCVGRNIPSTKAPKSLSNSEKQSGNFPGTAMLTNITCDNSDDKILPPLIVGQFGTSVYPFILHNHDETYDINQHVTCKISYKNAIKMTKMSHAFQENRPSMYSSLILESQFPILQPGESLFKYETVFGRKVKKPCYIPMELEEMNVTNLGKIFCHVMNDFGAAVFRTTNFDSIKPTIMTTYHTDKMHVYEQRLTNIHDTEGIYIITESAVGNLDTTEAEAMVHNLFQHIKSTVPTEQFFKVATEGFITSQFASVGKKYLYSSGNTAPLISDWSDHVATIFPTNTPFLQVVDKFHRTTNPKYLVSVGNFLVQAHVENRGLNAAYFLLIGVKVWAVLPKRQYPEFLKWLESKVGINDFNKCPNWFQHRIIFFDLGHIPECFDLTFIVQRAGDLLLLDNYAIYWGWSADVNVCIYYTWCNNQNWDAIQHFMPLCTHVDSLCSDPNLGPEELTLIRKNDNLITSSSIPTNLLLNPSYNHLTSRRWNNYPRNKISTSIIANDSHDLITSTATAAITNNDDDHAENEVNSDSSNSVSSKSSKRTSSYSPTDPSSSSDEAPSPPKKASIQRPGKKKIAIKCKFCDVRRTTLQSFRNHLSKSKICKEKKNLHDRFSIARYWHKEMKKEMQKKN